MSSEWVAATRTRVEYGIKMNGAFIDSDLIEELLDCNGPFDRALVIYDHKARHALADAGLIEASVSGRVWPSESGKPVLREMLDAISKRIREGSAS